MAISGWPNLALSEAMMISQSMASSQPPNGFKQSETTTPHGQGINIEGTSEGEAVDGSNDGLANIHDAVPMLEHAVLIDVREGLRGHLLDVGAS